MTQAQPEGPGPLSDASLMASGVQAFRRHPQATVEMVSRGSQGWAKYAALAEQQYRQTHNMFYTMTKGLGVAPRDTSPLWQSRRAATEALGPQSTAEYAVIASIGNMFTVATVVRSGDDLLVVGAGTTHPGAGGVDTSQFAVPGVDQFGDTMWYALNRLAAKERRTLVERVPSSWLGAKRQLTADDVEQLSEAATSMLPGATNPFPVLDQSPDAPTARAWMVRVNNFLRNGGTVSVQDHGEPTDAGRIAGARTLVASIDGVPQATLTVARTADGSIKDLGLTNPTDTGAFEALRLVTLLESARSGAPAVRRGGETMPPASSADLVAMAGGVLGERMDELPTLGWENAGASTTSLEEVAAEVGHFRNSGGGVRVLTPQDPDFVALREKVRVAMLGELAGGPRVPAGLGAVWQAFEPPGGSAEHPVGTAVVVAVDSAGMPVAAAAVQDTGHRLLLGTIGHTGSNPSAATAAVVDGVYRMAGKRPVAGYLSEPMAQAYGRAGARVGGPAAADATFLTGVGLDASAAAQITDQVDRQVPGPGPDDLDRLAMRLSGFQVHGGAVSVFDHATESGRRKAAGAVEAIHYATGRAPSSVQDPTVSGQVTVVAHVRGEPRAFVRFSTADGTFQEIDSDAISDAASNPTSDDHGAEAAVRYAVSHQVVSRGLTIADPIPSGEATWDARKSQYLLTGIKHRLGDGPRQLLRSSHEPPQPGDGSRDRGSGRRPDDTQRHPGR